MHMRDKEFSSFAFHIDSNSLPVLDPGYHVTVVKPKDKPLTSLANEVHLTVLNQIFDGVKSVKYLELIDLMVKTYAKEGYQRGINGVKELLKVLKENHVITHDDNGYTFHPEKLANAK